MAEAQPPALPAATRRTASFMTHPVFSSHQSEHQMLRYIFKLAQRDISLVHCMIPLGSCTMKLNATAEMMPITWPELNRIHPFAPAEQTQGYAELILTRNLNPNPNPNPNLTCTMPGGKRLGSRACSWSGLGLGLGLGSG